MRLLNQTPQRRRAAQPAHAANRELTHRVSNLEAPCAWSKPATATPAAAGSRSSISADAVIWTEPSLAETPPNNRAPSPVPLIPTHATPGASHPPAIEPGRQRLAADPRTRSQ